MVQDISPKEHELDPGRGGLVFYGSKNTKGPCSVHCQCTLKQPQLVEIPGALICSVPRNCIAVLAQKTRAVILKWQAYLSRRCQNLVTSAFITVPNVNVTQPKWEPGFSLKHYK